MRVGVDGSCWANRRGFGRFTRCLLTELVRRDPTGSYVLLLDAPSAADPELPALPEGLEVQTVAVDEAPASAAAADGNRGLLDLFRLSRGARRLGADVFFFPASYSYFPVVGTPVVVTVHDAIAERLPELVLPRRGDRYRWRLKQFMAVRQARAVLTVSQASRRAVADALSVPVDRLHVIREAPAPVFVPMPSERRAARLARFDLRPGDRYLLYVGGISPHKNLGVLVDSFTLLAGQHPDLRLILVGETDSDPFLSSTAAIRTAVAASPAADRISLTGYLPDEDLVALYGGAVATVLPSLGEGFGLTAAESAACGTPVVASRDPALVELLGDAGRYADASSPQDLASALDGLVRSPEQREEAATACLRRASAWSWATAADTTAAILSQVARR